MSGGVHSVPFSDADLYSDAVLLDPYPTYHALRSQGPAVWMHRHNAYGLARYENVRAALDDWATFSSASGVAMNDAMNEALKGGLLCSDPPRHDVLRKVVERPVTPKALMALRNTIMAEADALAERLVDQGSFDAATELAQHLPVTIVSDLVGLPAEGRDRMLQWAPANFDCLGPDNERGRNASPIVGEMINYAFTQCVPGKLKAGGWAAMIWEAAERGEIAHEVCPYLMNDYMGPSLDTTIFAITNAIWLFATHPEQWDIVRANPSLIPQAINEIVRLESPLQSFSRMTTRDTEVDGVILPAQSRVIILYGSANRDERKWTDPDRFDVLREGSQEHMAFGFGEHACVGNNLARLEMRALLTALAKRVQRFELGAVRRVPNNILRGIAQCEVTVR